MGIVCRGITVFGSAGKACHVGARCDLTWQAWLGSARNGVAALGTAGLARCHVDRTVLVSYVEAWLGRRGTPPSYVACSGSVKHGSHGEVPLSGNGFAWPGRRGKSGLGQYWQGQDGAAGESGQVAVRPSRGWAWMGTAGRATAWQEWQVGVRYRWVRWGSVRQAGLGGDGSVRSSRSVEVDGARQAGKG